ncbi:MAG: hypothetical protein ACE5J3_07915, partial [Methanosarcinales archaeon]
PLYPKDTIILVLDKEKAGLNFLSGISSSYGTGEIKVVYPETALLPTKWKGYDSVDLIVMGDFSLRDLTQDQQKAIENWVRFGGSLVVSTGANFLNYRGTFVEYLLPVKMLGSKTLTSLESLEKEKYGKIDLTEGFIVSDAMILDGKVMLYENGVPLIVKGRADNGKVIYLAFDYSKYPFKGWDGNLPLWKDIIFSVRDLKSFESQEQMKNMLWNVLRDLPVAGTPSFKFIGIFLLAYILILGPINYFVLKKKDKLEYAWFTIPIIVLLFSTFAYTVGYTIKGGDLLLNEVTIVNAYSDSHTAKVDSYFGLFSPARTSYKVEIKDGSGVVSEYNPRWMQSQNVLNIVEKEDSIILRDVYMNMWSMRTFSIESYINLKGALKANLTLMGNTVKGKIKNSLPYDLSDAFLVFGDYSRNLGEFRRGETININFKSVGGKGYPSLHIVRPMQYPPSSIRERILSVISQKGLSSNEGLLIGFATQSLIDIDLVDKEPKKEVQTLFLIHIPLESKEQNIFQILEGMSDKRIIEYSTNGTFEVQPDGTIRIDNGYYITQIELPIKAENVTADSLGVKFNAYSEFYTTTTTITLQIYNWKADEWDTLTTQTDHTSLDIMVPHPNDYVKFPRALIKFKVLVKSESISDSNIPPRAPPTPRGAYIQKLDIIFKGHRGD